MQKNAESLDALLAKPNVPTTPLLKLLPLSNEEFIPRFLNEYCDDDSIVNFLYTRPDLKRELERQNLEGPSPSGRPGNGLSVSAAKTHIALEHLLAAGLDPQKDKLWPALVYEFCPKHRHQKHSPHQYTQCQELLSVRRRQFRKVLEACGFENGELLSD